MLIGEVLGDSEDLAGKPFVGPAATAAQASPDEEMRREAREALFTDLAIVGEYFKKL